MSEKIYNTCVKTCDLCKKEYTCSSKASRRKICFECEDNINFKKKHTCLICGLFDENLTLGRNGRGRECGCNTSFYKNHLSKIIINNTKPGICTRCGNHSNERNAAGVCRKCGREINLNNYNTNISGGNCSNCGNFSEKRNMTGLCYTCMLKFNAKVSTFTSKIIINENGIDYIYDTKSENKILWNDFKDLYEFNIDTNIIKDIQNEFKKAKVYFTFRTQDSDNWYGARNLFERSLLDSGLDWFTYIKFYINKRNESLPLIVGKSGSLNVNYSGSDVCFSENEKDGNARVFLKQKNYKWDKTKILIIPANSELEAYDNESYIREKYDLFFS